MPSDMPVWTAWHSRELDDLLAHPDAPCAGTGPGFCAAPGPVIGDTIHHGLPHPGSPAAVYVWLDPTRPPSQQHQATGEKSAEGIEPPIKTIGPETQFLAAVIFGEASVKLIFEEMAGIGLVVVRQRDARGYRDVQTFLTNTPSFSYAVSPTKERFVNLRDASLQRINKELGMRRAVRAATYALTGKTPDYSLGAYFWDGADLAEKLRKGRTPFRAVHGFHFTDPAHDIYKLKDKEVPGENWVYLDKEHKKKGKSRGKWKYKFESVTSIGGTIFWKYNKDFLKSSGNTPHD